MPQEVPRRTVPEDKPQVAGETPATMKAGQKIGQKDDSTSIGLPDSNCNQPDMGEMQIFELFFTYEILNSFGTSLEFLQRAAGNHLLEAFFC